MYFTLIQFSWVLHLSESNFHLNPEGPKSIISSWATSVSRSVQQLQAQLPGPSRVYKEVESQKGDMQLRGLFKMPDPEHLRSDMGCTAAPGPPQTP